MKNRRFEGLLARAAGFALVSLSTACTVFLDHDPVQCSTDADCGGVTTASGDPTVCSSKHTCVPPEGYCATNVECLERSDPADPSLCRAHACVKVKSKECATLAADPDELAND